MGCEFYWAAIAVQAGKSAPVKIESLCQNVIFLNNLSAIGLGPDPEGGRPISDLWGGGEWWQVSEGDAFWPLCLQAGKQVDFWRWSSVHSG